MSTMSFNEYLQQTGEAYADRAGLLTRYRAGADDMRVALRGLDESRFDLARAGGKWTIRQIVHHVVNGDDVWATCIEAAIGNPGCSYSFGWYNYQTWVDELDFAGRPVDLALKLIDASRANLAGLVEQRPEVWERHVFVSWPQFNSWRRSTVHEMIFVQTYHVPWHIAQIEQTRQVHHC